MDLASILGIILGLGAVIGGQMLEGGSIMALVQPTAFMIVIGGTAGAVLLAFPMNEVISACAIVPYIFLGTPPSFSETIEKLVGMALKARKEGILALQEDIKHIDDEFLKKGLELMTDGTDPNLLRELLETQLSFMEEEIQQQCKFWESAGGFTPTVGILGAVLGLIHVMENLADPSSLGSGIAVAFVATVYGVGAANLLFIPMGSKIKFKRRKEIVMREMMIEGILSIQAGESPNFIKQKLQVFDHGSKADGDAEAA